MGVKSRGIARPLPSSAHPALARRACASLGPRARTGDHAAVLPAPSLTASLALSLTSSLTGSLCVSSRALPRGRGGGPGGGGEAPAFLRSGRNPRQRYWSPEKPSCSPGAPPGLPLPARACWDGHGLGLELGAGRGPRCAARAPWGVARRRGRGPRGSQTPGEGHVRGAAPHGREAQVGRTCRDGAPCTPPAPQPPICSPWGWGWPETPSPLRAKCTRWSQGSRPRHVMLLPLPTSLLPNPVQFPSPRALGSSPLLSLPHPPPQVTSFLFGACCCSTCSSIPSTWLGPGHARGP